MKKNHTDLKNLLYHSLELTKKDFSLESNQKNISLLNDAVQGGLRQWRSYELVTILNLLSGSYLVTGNYEAAFKTTKKALKLQGENLFSCGHLLYIAIRMGDVRLAHYWLKKALKYKHEDPELAEALVVNSEKLRKENMKC